MVYIADMTNQQLMDNGNRMMDETDQAIERSKKVGSSQEITFLSENKLCPFPGK